MYGIEAGAGPKVDPLDSRCVLCNFVLGFSCTEDDLQNRYQKFGVNPWAALEISYLLHAEITLISP